MAILEGIPPGSYRLHVFSDQWCAFETRYLGGADIQFPIKRLEVTVVPVLAAVFNLPQGTQEDVSVLWYQWRRQMEFARIPLLVRDYAEIALRTRYPKAAFIVARVGVGPEPGKRLGAIRLETLLSNGAKCFGVADMMPAADVRPVTLSVRQFVPMRTVRVRGFINETPIAPLRLELQSGRHSIPIVAGIATEIPCGSLRINLPGYAAPGDGDWKPSQIHVPEGVGVFEVKLKLRRPVRMVRVVVRFENVDSSEPVWFLMKGDNGYTMGLTPRQKNIFDFALPYGKARFTASTDGHGQVTREVTIDRDSPARVELVIPELL